MELQIIGAGLLVMLASLLGVLFTHKVAARFLEEKLSYLVSFSAGVFLVTSGALALEVFELADTAFMAVLLIGAGYMLAWGLEYLIPETHQHHDPECDHDHHHGNKTSARKLIVGDAVHNVADGIMLVPAFLVSPALGIAVTVSILIHEALQEVSEFFVLRQAGYSTKRALLVNFAVSSTIFIGIGLSYLAVVSHDLEVLLLALAAGFFLHVVLHDLIPKPHHHADSTGFVKHLVVLVIGLAVMSLVAFAIKGEHVHGEGDMHAHEEEHHDEQVHGSSSTDTHTEVEPHNHE
ncbi:MAG: ZIP family metal transporter [Candidatus Pacebacteria bacterium]|jgi:zinc transporter ZupT|nr:ZIP family metal transporter [Candidatus Paceibacterota bacterium]